MNVDLHYILVHLRVQSPMHLKVTGIRNSFNVWQEHEAAAAAIAAEPAEHVAVARGWGCSDSGLVVEVQQCQAAARSGHG